jgi:hypothetical protein
LGLESYLIEGKWNVHLKEINNVPGKIIREMKPKGTTLGIRYVWLIIISAILRWLPFALSDTSSFLDFKRICLILSYVFLLFALFRNFHMWAARVIAFGVLLNFVAIISNAGFMPVSPEARFLAGKIPLEIQEGGIAWTKSGGVLLAIAQTRLWFLTDIIPVSFFHIVFSIGDVFIGAGFMVMCIEVIIIAGKIVRTLGRSPSAEEAG